MSLLQNHRRWLCGWSLIFAGGFVGPSPHASAQVAFEIRLLCVDANEGMAAADIDGDGKMDLVAGRNWFRGGDWASRPLRAIDDWNGYVKSNGDYLWDVDQDGRMDVVAGDFLGTQVRWFRNPGGDDLRLGKVWPDYLLVDTGASANEGQLMDDLDGDGVPEWIVNSWKKAVPTVVWRFQDVGETPQPNGPSRFQLVPHQLGSIGNGHGVGVGDLSGDGKPDLLVGEGWYEQPAENPWASPWAFHADWDLHASLPMFVRDVDADGDQDILFGNGHDFGLQWWQNMGPGNDGKIQWREHLIDRSFSQPHSMVMADLNGDGRDDLITGKRYYAHNGNDPGGGDPPCLVWYDIDPTTQKFTKHVIDEGRVGTGLQIVAKDLNGDGRCDIAVAGKSGTYLLLQQ